jgi:hypothetical protein
VGDDEIEAPEIVADVQDIELPELDILEAKSARALLAFSDSCRSEIDAHAFSFRQAQCHRCQIETITAAKLKNPRTGNVRRFHSKECSDSCEPIRVSLRQGMPRIRDVVIRRYLSVHRFVGLKDCHRPIATESGGSPLLVVRG